MPTEPPLDVRLLVGPTWTATNVRGVSYKRYSCIGLIMCIANSPNCCSGQYVQPGSCPSSRIQYYDFFSESTRAFPMWGTFTELCASESNCPRSYVYAYDESSGTALFTCGQDQNSDYTVTFCP